jgi:nucleotide-binding universal stress UspA family protein
MLARYSPERGESAQTYFGAASTVALSYARELASATGASLYLLHVVDDIAVPFMEGPYAQLGEVQTSMEKEARRELDDLSKGQDPGAPEVHTAVLTSTAPASAIVGYAADEHIDVIVMGTHGRAPVVRVFLGAVADRVVRTAPYPVLTVRGPKSEKQLSEEREYAAPPMAL